MEKMSRIARTTCVIGVVWRMTSIRFSPFKFVTSEKS
jgi:hypothetical protein